LGYSSNSLIGLKKYKNQHATVCKNIKHRLLSFYLVTVKTNNSNVTIIHHCNPGLYLPVLCIGKTGKILKNGKG
jgi:hypothetical protein